MYFIQAEESGEASEEPAAAGEGETGNPISQNIESCAAHQTPEAQAASKKPRLFLSPKKRVIQERKKTGQHEDARADAAFEILKNISRKDECSTFADHIGIKLRKLHDRARSIVMHEINTLIFRAEIGMYDSSENQQQGYNSFSSTPASTPQSHTSWASPPQTRLFQSASADIESYQQSPSSISHGEEERTGADSALPAIQTWFASLDKDD